MLVEIVAFVLGFLSIFSPCVLPIVPIVFGVSRMRLLDTMAVFFGLILAFLILSMLSIFLIPFKFLGYFLLFFLSAYLFDERIELFLNRKFSSLRFLSDAKVPPFLYGFFLAFFWLPCITPFLGLAISTAIITERATEISLLFTTGVASALFFLTLVGKKFNIQWDKLRKPLGVAVMLTAIYFIASTISF